MSCSMPQPPSYFLILISVIIINSSSVNAKVPIFEYSNVWSNSHNINKNISGIMKGLNYVETKSVPGCMVWTCTRKDIIRDNLMNSQIDTKRRKLLLSTGTIGVIGATFATVPFLKSWLPSERAKAFGGPVKANISKLQTGQMLSIQWRGQPVFIVNRTKTQTEVLSTLNNRLKDPLSESSIQPKFIDSIYRAKKDKILVVIGICTHLGCVPKYLPELVPQQFDKDWKGGFFCPCHNSRFDISGRVFNGSPASRNLDIPPHVYLDEHTIEIGNVEEQA